MVLDKGLGLETADSLMRISGEYVDYLKFGWGTVVVHERDMVKSKLIYQYTDIRDSGMFEKYYKHRKGNGIRSIRKGPSEVIKVII